MSGSFPPRAARSSSRRGASIGRPLRSRDMAHAILNGAPVALASYDEKDGHWKADSKCFRLPDYLKESDAKTLYAASPDWMGHRIDSPVAVRYTALFPAFEVDAMST